MNKWNSRNQQRVQLLLVVASTVLLVCQMEFPIQFVVVPLACRCIDFRRNQLFEDCGRNLYVGTERILIQPSTAPDLTCVLAISMQLPTLDLWRWKWPTSTPITRNDFLFVMLHAMERMRVNGWIILYWVGYHVILGGLSS